MTANTPAHLERRALLEHFHFFDFTVALLALDSCATLVLGLHVTFVRETNKIWAIVHLDPFNGLIFLVGFSYLFNWSLVSMDNLVTSHTGVTRRNTSGKRSARARVAILARNFAFTRVHLMVEWYWLFRLVADVVDCVARRPKPPGIRRCCLREKCR